MSHIAEQRAEGKSKAQRDRDLLLGQLREAATRSRLQTTIFENLGNQLRMGQLDRSGVIDRLKQEDLRIFYAEVCDEYVADLLGNC